MTKRIKIAATLIAAAAGTVCASANSITVTELPPISQGGGSLWTYDLSFVNSTLNNGDFVTINDFGSATVSVTPGPGWVFSQALTGPNSLPATDSGSILNATITWEGGNGVVVSPDPATTVNGFLTLTSATPLSGSKVFSDYTTIDQVTSGEVAGTDSRVIGSVETPNGVPDGGSTLAMLGLTFIGAELVRRMTARGLRV